MFRRAEPQPPTFANGLVEQPPNRNQVRPSRVDGDYRRTLLDRLELMVQRTISQNRRRLEYQNLNLDMAYITDRIIAIGFPSQKLEQVYRNSMKWTKQMLFRRHGAGNVKVFNLRGGELYDPRHFDNNLIYMNMRDHHPPALELMAPFCREAKEWLEDPNHVIAVHCKAGKGRTGVMICALLVYMNFYPNPRQILDYYSIARTENNEGVTIPSQRRYVYYFNHLREKQMNYFPRRQQLVAIYLERPPRTGKDGCHMKITVANGTRVVSEPAAINLTDLDYIQEHAHWKKLTDFDTEEPRNRRPVVSHRAWCFKPEHEVFLEGDVRVNLVKTRANCFQTKKIGHVWFNTYFGCEDDFVYGDKKWPYTEFNTSIATHKETPGTSERCTVISEPQFGDIDVPQKMYRNNGMVPPRDTIMDHLKDAHKAHMVQDTYNNRRWKTGRGGRIGAYTAPGTLLDTTKLPDGTNGPFQVPLNQDEHVLTFSAAEIDRACKQVGKDIDKGMKLHVVLKCIDSSDKALYERSEKFCRDTYDVDQSSLRAAEHRRNQRFPPPNPDKESKGAERMYRPMVLYAHNGTYYGKANENLIDDYYKTNPLAAGTGRYARYFFRQRKESPSRYPDNKFECPLTKKTFDFREGERGPDEVPRDAPPAPPRAPSHRTHWAPETRAQFQDRMNQLYGGHLSRRWQDRTVHTQPDPEEHRPGEELVRRRTLDECRFFEAYQHARYDSITQRSSDGEAPGTSQAQGGEEDLAIRNLTSAFQAVRLLRPQQPPIIEPGIDQRERETDRAGVQPDSTQQEDREDQEEHDARWKLREQKTAPGPSNVPARPQPDPAPRHLSESSNEDRSDGAGGTTSEKTALLATSSDDNSSVTYSQDDKPGTSGPPRRPSGGAGSSGEAGLGL